jgi:hypothetical protein
MIRVSPSPPVVSTPFRPWICYGSSVCPTVRRRTRARPRRSRQGAMESEQEEEWTRRRWRLPVQPNAASAQRLPQRAPLQSGARARLVLPMLPQPPPPHVPQRLGAAVPPPARRVRPLLLRLLPLLALPNRRLPAVAGVACRLRRHRPGGRAERRVRGLKGCSQRRKAREEGFLSQTRRTRRKGEEEAPLCPPVAEAAEQAGR